MDAPIWVVKKVVGPFFLPASLCFEILIVALVLLWFTRKQRAGKLLVTIGAALFALFGYSASSSILLKPLEYRYPPVLSFEKEAGVKWVVVLGGGHASDARLPVTSQIEETALVRLVEGIRVHRMLPGSKLVLSGGPVFDRVPEAKLMAKLAEDLGVSREQLVLEESSRDTKDEAKLIRKIIGRERFVLVTSASHMPRAVALFRKQGMNPIPDPTGHLVKESTRLAPNDFFPSAHGFQKAKRAIYEYLGLLWGKVRGQLSFHG